MTDYVSDREQVEMLKKWWNDYGKAIAIAVVIGLVVGFGWRFWQKRHQRESQLASVTYQMMGTALATKNAKAVNTYASQLMTKYSNTPYASLAGFVLAKQSIDNKKYAQAEKNLNWVIKNGKPDSFKQIARLRAARVYLMQKKPQQAMQVLSVVNDKTFAPLIDNIKGDVYLAEGKVAQAKASYSKAKQGLSTVGMPDPLIDMKLIQSEKS